MADTTTTNLSLTKPELDVSTNWGQKLNANLDAIDAIFSGTGTAVSLNIDGGDIASAVTINKSPVITLGGDLTGNVTLTNLASGTLTASLVAESVQDIVGPMFSSNTENGISVGYEDSDGTIDLSVLVDDSSIEINSLNNTLNVKASGVTNAMLAGSIANSKLANSTVSYGGVSLALGASDATPAFDLSDATAYSGDSSLVTTGALNSGSITSGFGSIDVGSSAITTTGTVTGGTLAGTLSTAAQTNITSVGTLSSLTVSGDVTVDTNTLKVDTTNNRVGILNASPDVSLDVGSATDAIHVPVGTTAQRPTGANGYFRYNSDDAQFEGYADGAWGAIAGGGGGSSSTFAKNTFAGDDSTTAFTLTTSMTNEDGLIVFIDGVYQADNVYSVSGTTLTFATAPVNGRVIEVFQLEGGIVGVAPVIATMTGDGSDTTLALGTSPDSENQTFVTIDGVVQHKDTYSISGSTLTFSAAPPNGTSVEAVIFNNVSIATFQDADGDTKIQLEESTDDDTIRMDIAGTEVLTLTNSAMTLKGTTPTITIGDGGAEDTKIVFDGNAQDYYIGLDDSADDLIIGRGSTVGTTPNIQINESNEVHISPADSDVKLFIGSEGGAFGGNSSHNIRASGNDLMFNSADDFMYESGGTEVMRLLNDGNLLLGTTSATASEVRIDAQYSANPVIQVKDTTNNIAVWMQATDSVAAIVAPQDYPLIFSVGASQAERMRIDSSGNVVIGGTTAGRKFHVNGITRLEVSTAVNYPILEFYNTNGEVGRVRTSGIATAYDTSSDYRLKENVRPMENGLDRLNNLKPVKFDWKVDGTTSEGFIAHEAQEVFPDAVGGQKDGEDMQGMDYGRITPLLVKAIQEQQTIIEDLKARIETLEGGE